MSEAQPSLQTLARDFLTEFGRRVAEPIVISVGFATLLVLAGFVAIGLSWKGAAATLLVPVQMAYFVSGSLGGIALILLGTGVLHTQGLRWIEARQRLEIERTVREAERLLREIHALRVVGEGDPRKTMGLVSEEPKKPAPNKINKGSHHTPG